MKNTPNMNSLIYALFLFALVACNSNKKTEAETTKSETTVATDVKTTSKETCEADKNYISEKGHANRDRSIATLQAGFKGAAQKNFEDFMAIAADPYIQHSPDLADGWKPVWDLLVNRPKGFSSKQMTWLGNNGFLDNSNFLVMLREVDRADGTPPSKIVDIMRFDDEGKYAEHWDIKQPISKQTASGRSETTTANMFADKPVEYSIEQEEKNKEIAVNFLNTAFNNGKLDDALDKMVYKDYIQHNPFITDGIQPVKDIFASGKIPALCYDIKYVLAQNDIVVVYSKVTSKAGISAVVDILRIRDDMLVEHWDVVEAVPADNDMPHSNSMF